jgi:hypothetical protein
MTTYANVTPSPNEIPIAGPNSQIDQGWLPDSGASAGTYGSGTFIPVLTVDEKGRITLATTAPIGGAAPFTVSLSTGVNLVDSVLVDAIGVAIYDVQLIKDSTGARYSCVVRAQHDGTTTDDATDTDYIITDTLITGTVDVSLLMEVNGTGISQTMRLKANASSAGWVLRYLRRTIDA